MKFASAASVLLTGLVLAASNWAAGATADALLQQGETLYRSGTSTRQNPVIAVVSGGTRLPGSAASCAALRGNAPPWTCTTVCAQACKLRARL